MKHRIKTLQDIISCTNEDNIDNFMKDLRIFLETVHDIRNLAESISPETVISDEFIWVDDGKHTTKINFEKPTTTLKIDKQELETAKYFIEIPVTSCCEVGPITKENYCPNCGRKIERS